MLRDFKVETEVVALLADRMGDLSNAVTLNELYFGIYVPSCDTYYWPMNKNSTHSRYPIRNYVCVLRAKIECHIYKG